MVNVYEAIAQNKRRSFLLLFFFFLFLITFFWIIFYTYSLSKGFYISSFELFIFSFLTSFLLSFFSYYFSDKIILTISGAREADRNKDFHFYTSVENLCIGTGMPFPKLYVIEDSAPNAFATGRNPKNAVLCVTRGLLQKLNRSELEAVLAHELSHIRHYDILLATLVSVLVGFIVLVSDWLIRYRGFYNDSGERKERNSLFFFVYFFVLLISPLIGRIIQFALSRQREYMADAGAVKITKQPLAMISALKKIANDEQILESANKATAHLFIINPFKQVRKKGILLSFANLFNTHPPIEERIKRLEKML